MDFMLHHGSKDPALECRSIYSMLDQTVHLVLDLWQAEIQVIQWVLFKSMSLILCWTISSQIVGWTLG